MSNPVPVPVELMDDYTPIAAELDEMMLCWFCESSLPMRFLKKVGRRFQCVSDDACERRYNAMLKAKQP